MDSEIFRFRFEKCLDPFLVAPNSEWIFSGSWRLGSSIGKESSGMGIPRKVKKIDPKMNSGKSFEPKPPVFLGAWGTCIDIE